MSKISELSRKAAAEGMVLLKNSERVLPLTKGDEVAIFGRCQLNFYKSGTGSGGAVHVPYTVNVIEGLRQYPEVIINENLLKVYQEWVKENPFDDGGGGWAAEPWFQKEMPITEHLVKEAASTSDKAIIIIGRTAGEDQDNADVPGSYRLTDDEINMLKKVTDYFEDVIVVLNVSNIIDMSFMKRDYKNPIKGVLYAWHGGMEGGNALADILLGTINPSGRLTDSIANNLFDYPSHENFCDKKENYYTEDIYVGYRYFETFNQSAIMYPFGYGLSYTTFEVSNKAFIVNDDYIKISGTVKNTGNLPGKEVIQVYCRQPQGKLGKPAVVLVGFTKSDTLQPGEIWEYTLEVEKSTFASYDDGGYTAYKNAFILEAGEYDFYIGHDVRNLVSIGSYIQELKVIERLQEALAPRKPFKRIRPVLENDEITIKKENVPIMNIDLEKRMKSELPEAIKMREGNANLESVEKGEMTLDTFIAHLPPKALGTLVKAEGMCSPKVTAGTASAFGGVSDELLEYGIPVLACADGPSGIRLDSGKTASQVPIGTALACTWNTKLVEKLYEQIGKELYKHRIDTLLGPGMNIHRHPLNGRNFEYFSEDPLINGLLAVAVTKGLEAGGSTATLKHFLVNNQEAARNIADSIVSERALREIYLKGFEIAVKQGGARSIMTSYNPINGIYAASNYDLNTTILRNEWDFEGIVMTDWWAKVNHPIQGGKGETYHKSYMVKAQNDLYMVVDNHQATEFEKDDILEAYHSGTLTLGELQRSAKNILKFILSSPSYKRKDKQDSKKRFAPKQSAKYKLYPAGTPIEAQKFTLEIKDDGKYQVIVSARYQSMSAAQSTVNIRINDDIAFIHQMHGSKADYKDFSIVSFDLSKGFYNVKLEFIRKGIEVEHIRFEKAK